MAWSLPFASSCAVASRLHLMQATTKRGEAGTDGLIVGLLLLRSVRMTARLQPLCVSRESMTCSWQSVAADIVPPGRRDVRKGIEVNPRDRPANGQGGALWRDLDRTTQAFGLAVPGGTDSEVGIAGLTLGGGNGWLMGLHGATCDNLLSANLVTADGAVVTANSAQNPDLLWALRGGGGNFGIVTSLRYRLYPVGPTVLGGPLMYDYRDREQG